LTIFVHGQSEFDKAVETTQKLFSNTKAPIDALSVEDLESIEGIVRTDYAVDKINAGVDILSFLTENAVFESKGAARKMLQNGGVSINREKITDMQMMVEKKHLLHDKFILVQVGKKNYYLVAVV
jgi:tyrosyl-tRNA synthetase